MAIELCPAGTTPRTSFSHGFCSSMQQCRPPLRPTPLTLNSSPDFEFDVPVQNTDQECYYSSADELFSDGKILPLQIRKKISPHKQEQDKEPSTAGNATPKDIKAGSKEATYQNQSCKLFWQFKRSNSLNYVGGNKPRLSPSTLLSRCSSTGSSNQRQNYQKEKTYPACLQSSRKNQKPPLKKSFAYGCHGNGLTINPVLNVPSVDVFCLSSVFLTSKYKKK